LATQVVSRIREALGVEIGLRVMFERPTVEGIGEEVERERRKKRDRGVELEEGAGRIERAGRVEVGDGVREAPLSYAQQRLWFIQQLEPESVAYNIPRAIRLRGELDVESLRQSLREIARRHEVLRTRFEGRGGIPVQVIEEGMEVELREWDISGEEESKREVLGRRIVREEAGRAFDLERGPVWRGAVIRLGEEDHVLVLNIHHIVSDAWSTGVMVKEFGTLYEWNREGRGSGLGELEIQYADYAKWQRGWLRGEVLEEEMEYWRRELRGVGALEIPTDRMRPAVASHRGAKVAFRLTEELTEELRGVSRREGVTLFMTLLAAYQAVLSRYAGQDDFAVGTPIANRGRLETEGLIGFFINQLVLRTDLGGNPSVGELLVRVRERTLGAYAHQEVPFEKLVEELSPERELSRPPLSQVELVLHNTPLANRSVAGIEFTPYTEDYGFAKFELMLLLGEGRGISGTAEYATDLFERTTIERFVDHVYLVLSLFAKDTRSRIRDIDLLTAGERQRLLFDWNDTDCDYGDARCLHQLFEQQTERTPDTVVAHFDEHQLSYGELNGRSNQLARVLNVRSVTSEARVGVCIGRSLEMLVGILGALKAGVAYVPMDPSYPEDRILYMMADSDVTLVLTQGKYKSIAAQAPIDRICLDSDWNPIATESYDNLNEPVHPEMLAYVIYTSGSTGQPKGVSISHRSAWSFLNWADSGYGAAGGATVLASTSICFDLSIFELFLPLCFGGRIVIAENALGLPGLAVKDSVSLINTVPSAIAALLDGGHLPEAVGTVNLAGEALSGELVERLYEAGMQNVYNLYGPTETTTYSTFGRADRAATAAPTIGRPVGNTQIYLLDESWCSPPVGAIGEIYIGGSGLARGYLKRPDLTAERFMPCASKDQAGARLYRTGDVARYRQDGRIDYLGRRDRQVKIRGYRIELGEIESVLAAHQTVRQCAVTISEDEMGDKRIVAYVSRTPEADGAVSALRAYASEKLPGYMVPHTFVELPELPVTANGKLDRKALPAAKSESSLGELAGLRTPVEEIVAGVWSDVLRLDGIGATDDFFELGGHSLLATQVISRLRESLHVDLPLRLLFEQPTVGGFAEAVEKERRAGGEFVPSAIAQADRTAELPLSYAQQRLWFLQQLASDIAAYNIPRALRLSGPLSSFGLRQSMHEIVRRHEVLRTRFQVLSGVPRLEIDGSREIDLPLCDLRGISEEEQKSIVEKLFAKEGKGPFDLTTGPLWRARLLQSKDEEHTLLLCMHHIVSDAWSVSVMVNEINSFYDAYVAGGVGCLPELAVQYADFAVWQRRWLQAEVLAAHTTYWREKLAGAKLLELPTDRPRPSTPTYRGAQERFSLSEDVTRRLQELSRREGVTLFMTLLAAVQLLLARYTGQEDVAIGTVIAGRDRTETEKLIGFFVNQLVMRTDLSGNPSVHELLGRVRDTALGAYAHQELPFERLIEELQLHRQFGSQPFSQFVFAFQNVPKEKMAFSNIRVAEDSLNLYKANFDLTLFMALDRGQIRGSLIYATDLYNRETIRRLLWRLERVLESLLAYAEPLAGAARTTSG
jgi:amino acid adenylation domain-containing protein